MRYKSAGTGESNSKMIEVVEQTQLGMKARVMALMSYLGVLVFVPLMMNRDDPFVNFHARQGLIIWIFGIAALSIRFLPGIGNIVFSIVAILVSVYSLVGLISVLLSKEWKLPAVYGLSAKL